MSLRIAIIGLGHGQSHAQSIAKDKRLSLAAVVDTNPQTLEACSARLKVPGFTSVAALLDAGVADAAVAAVPTPAHAPVTCALLDAGLHVLLEKPLCRDEAEAARIAASLRASGRVLQIGYCVRSSGIHRSILQHLRRGDLGTLTNIWYCQHTRSKGTPGDWRDSRENMGGKFFDCAVHYVDILQQWAGAPLVRVAAFGNELGKVGPEATKLPLSAAVSLEYANGVRGTYNFSETANHNDDASFGLVGTSGRIMGNPWLPLGAGSFELRTQGGMVVSNSVFDPAFTSPGHLGFAEEMVAFADTVLEGKPNVCSYDDALALHRQMVAIDRAFATGQVISLD